MKSEIERFESKFKKGTDNECWEWTAYRNIGGYGVFYVNEKCVRAHRFSWEFNHGEIPKRMYILHKCDNPPCVNINHLFIGTQKDNMKDMKNKNRHTSGERSVCHKLTEKQIFEIRDKASKGFTNKKLAEEYKVSSMLISYIKRKMRWSHI